MTVANETSTDAGVATAGAGRVAVVSGGAAGIGYSIADRLAKDGFTVAILTRTEGAAEDAATEIERTGGTARGYRADVSDRAQVDAALAQIRAELGPVAVLVANAAVAPNKAFLDTTLDEWENTLRINLTGTFNLVQSGLPDLLAAGAGRVVLISSSSAQRGAPRMAAYASSKGGQLALTKALAVEFSKQGVTVNTVVPSSIDTPSVEKKRAAGLIPSAEEMGKYIPVGRVGTGADIAGAVSYLVSDDASYVTGQTISVNGGSFIG
ncbi:SDR family NAD(P)-dependent oxidoreductase [Leucobacter luti]|uniref:2-hydroxycyclohexanecarboxyl-CoA dehydrogenase n=1 Tax=Leucobacter luti TaxID=340320 RepID=A0A4Q7U403_9MICO|nr:SDR family NAD(P)-dependent oxidoreductase [Leucobacter luti]MBL3699556.1 SDR family oxidoreductase [Leucobacter luti]RZT67068.1 2-hydroxycyclohexanecarboxyl-CoA dehydrogenase [Leucobacter luti]